MDSTIRDILKSHQRLFNVLRKGEPKTPKALVTEIGVSATTIYKWLDEGKKYGIYKVNSNNQFELCIDKRFFEIITIEGNTYRTIRTKIREILSVMSDDVLLVVFIINMKTASEKKILFDNFAFNIFNGIELTQSKELFVVDKDTLRIIHVKNRYSTKKNIVYYNIFEGRFCVIEDDYLKVKENDDYYGVIPMLPDEKRLLHRLHDLDGDEYISFYQDNKEMIYQTIIPKFYSISVFFRPDIVVTDMEVLKPNITSNIYEDIECYMWNFFPEDANAFNQSVVFENFTDEDLGKAAEMYAENKFFNWKISWN